MNIEEYLSSFTRNDYQRDNFDEFLRKIKFSFNLPAIHIAGTNGKGSTALYLKNIYQNCGYSVGIFTSPDDFLNTIRVNDTLIELTFVEQLIKEYDKLFKKYDLSSFEIQTFIAFSYFSCKKVDLAIIECGMGGELDATNIFTPILSIITSISIEHSSFLGDSLSEIALHKAGIIKENVPVLFSHLKGDALTVVVKKAKQENSKIYEIEDYNNLKQSLDGARFDYRPYFDLYIPTPTSYSVVDATIALEASKILFNIFPVNEEGVKKGLQESKLKCRFEQINSKKLIILDGAHNPEGISKLREECDSLLSGRKIDILFASFRDKNITSMLPEIGLLGDLHLTTFNHPRARKEDEYFLFLSDYEFVEDYKSLINALLEKEETDVILVTGSLAFTYEVRKFLENK